MKRKNFLFFSWAVIALLAYSCKEKEVTPPSAEFSIKYKNIREPLRAPMVVEFSAQEDGATYQWSYADGLSTTSISGKTLGVKFVTSGTKTITLTTTKNGISTVKSQTISVSPAYTNMRIKKVTLSSFPATNNGSSWDNFFSPSDKPDVYHEITLGNALLSSGATIDNLATSAYWNYPTPLIINATFAVLPLTVRFWDDDPPYNQTASENMGSMTITVANFITENEGLRYPTLISGGTSTPTIIEVDWQ